MIAELTSGPQIGAARELIERNGLNFETDFESRFVFSKPDYARRFEALSFTRLASQGKVSVLECGNGPKSWRDFFAVREDRPLFPVDVRFRAVREVGRDIGNVILPGTARDIVSSATSPSHILKQDDRVARIPLELEPTDKPPRFAERRRQPFETNCNLT